MFKYLSFYSSLSLTLFSFQGVFNILIINRLSRGGFLFYMELLTKSLHTATIRKTFERQVDKMTKMISTMNRRVVLSVCD